MQTLTLVTELVRAVYPRPKAGAHHPPPCARWRIYRERSKCSLKSSVRRAKCALLPAVTIEEFLSIGCCPRRRAPLDKHHVITNSWHCNFSRHRLLFDALAGQWVHHLIFLQIPRHHSLIGLLAVPPMPEGALGSSYPRGLLNLQTKAASRRHSALLPNGSICRLFGDI